MTRPTPRHRPMVTLLNEEALAFLPAVPDDGAPGEVIVAGASIVTLTLAELALPGARMIWTDFRQSASLGRLHGHIQSLGGLDRLILGGDGTRSEEMFSLMCAVLSFLPALRQAGRAEIRLLVSDGPAAASLVEFLKPLAPRLHRDGISVTLALHQHSPALAVPG